MGERAPEIERFAKQVRLMRELQRRFFAGDRSSECLILAMEMERKVDRSIAYILGRSAQAALFPTEDGPDP